jgi:3-oxoacyl-[acyl-carrier-protein] synthase-3
MNNDMKFPEIRPLYIDRYARILSTGIGLPENIVTNRDIIDKYDIIATDRAVEYTLGIKERRWTGLDEKLEDLMEKAVSQCLKRANVEIEQVDRIIYTKLFGDYQVPASSIGVLKKLRAKTGVPAFDITSACSGFMHAMDLAMRFIASGDDYVIVIGGSVMGKCVHFWQKPDPKTVFLFGDAIVAMLLGYSDVKHILSSYILTNSSLYDNALIQCGTGFLREGIKGLDSSIFFMKIADGNVVFQSSAKYSKIVAEKLLSETEYSIDDLDYFITSDQSTKIWEAQLRELGIPPEKSLSQYYKYGNTVAAMSPLNLDALIQSGRLKRGNLVMMQAHGAGASSGGMLFIY